MLQDLEEEIRQFVQRWNEKQLMLQEQGLEDAPSSSDEDSEDEIVFVGRNGKMHDSPEHRRRLRQMREEMSSHNERHGVKMVFESLVDDRAAGFGFVPTCSRPVFHYFLATGKAFTDKTPSIGAGLSTASHHTMVFIPGLSQWGTRPAARPTLGSIHPLRVAEMDRSRSHHLPWRVSRGRPSSPATRSQGLSGRWFELRKHLLPLTYIYILSSIEALDFDYLRSF